MNDSPAIERLNVPESVDQVAGFRRIVLKPRERKTVRFRLIGQVPSTLSISVGGLTRRIKIGAPATE